MGRGRPATPIGAWGQISSFLVEAPNGAPRWRAVARFREGDGSTSPVSREATTKGKAENRLREALAAKREQVTGDLITSDTLLTTLGEHWYEANKHRLAAGSEEQYAAALRKHMDPRLGQLRIREVKPALLMKPFDELAAAAPGSAKILRTVLIGMFDHAMKYGAIQGNPARGSLRMPRATSAAPRSVDDDGPRALTRTETDDLCDAFRTDLRATEALDLPDLVDWMLGTGCRIGEALAARDVGQAAAGTWEVNATLKRVTGVGIVIQERTKSDAGHRVLALPPGIVAMAARRDVQADARKLDTVMVMAMPSKKVRAVRTDVLFPAPAGSSLRDPSNTAGDLREVLDRACCPVCGGRGWHPELKTPLQQRKPPPVVVDRHGQVWNQPCSGAPPFAWVHSHVFRKTVATRLDEAGCTPRQIADQLGHRKPSMTLDVYLGRKVVSSEAARILER